MNLFRFMFGLPEKIYEPPTQEAPDTTWKVCLYPAVGLKEHLIEEEPYCDDGGSLFFTTNDGKEHCFHGEWEYFEL
jgi:hypothetical protein